MEDAQHAWEKEGRLSGVEVEGNLELKLGRKEKASRGVWIMLEENHYQRLCGIRLY